MTALLIVLVLTSGALGDVLQRLLGQSDRVLSLKAEIASHSACAPIRLHRLVSRAQGMLGSSAERDGTSQIRFTSIWSYANAALGVSFAAFGLAGILALAFERVGHDDGKIVIGASEWRADLARLLGITIIGMLVWLWHWRRISRIVASERWVEAHPGSERNSLARRIYLLAVCAAAVVALFLSLASLITDARHGAAHLRRIVSTPMLRAHLPWLSLQHCCWRITCSNCAPTPPSARTTISMRSQPPIGRASY